MQFTLTTLTALLSLTSAAAINARSPSVGKLVARQAGVCGALATPVCCQLDVLGIANLNCENGMYIPISRELANMKIHRDAFEEHISRGMTRFMCLMLLEADTDIQNSLGSFRCIFEGLMGFE